MDDAKSDVQLVRRAQRGDRRAFEFLMLKYQQRITHLVNRIILNSEDSLDVTQEIFIRAYRALPGFRGTSAFYTWLYRIAVNTSRNYLSTQSRRLSVVGLPDRLEQSTESSTLKEESMTPEHILLSRELEEIINTAFRNLPENLRAALSLREIDGLGYEEIAQAMSCPIGTVRSRIFRAREALEQHLRAALDEGRDHKK